MTPLKLSRNDIFIIFRFNLSFFLIVFLILTYFFSFLYLLINFYLNSLFILIIIIITANNAFNSKSSKFIGSSFIISRRDNISKIILVLLNICLSVRLNR